MYTSILIATYHVAIYYVFSAQCNCQVMIEVLCAELE